MRRRADERSAHSLAAAKPGLDRPRIPRALCGKGGWRTRGLWPTGQRAGGGWCATVKVKPGDRFRVTPRVLPHPAAKGARGNRVLRAPSVSLRSAHLTQPQLPGRRGRQEPSAGKSRPRGREQRPIGLEDLINPPANSSVASFLETLPGCSPLPPSELPGAQEVSLGSPPAAPSLSPNQGPHVSHSRLFMARPLITCPFARPPPLLQSWALLDFTFREQKEHLTRSLGTWHSSKEGMGWGVRYTNKILQSRPLS